ncbi:uncharacterized protein N7503_003820 [Penicillium pulvis]|uniref:uncharacterized protein n=1 Tax=Penicillium pulvis TaxID=1562058 RepID=UPI002547F8F0|nr:uncharacterized protein N7503_003820 [Penicillium pulvis]KAJ5806218.1 hypothetical protein N7503_003820 [Penicillium pulvis]
MKYPSKYIALLFTYGTVGFADYLGPTYPPPVDLSSQQSLVTAAWKNLTTTLDSYLKRNPSGSATTAVSRIQNTTFSTNIFSIHDSNAAKLQYHWTSPEIASSKNGTNKVNGDSIYRMASATKLYTTYAGMIALTEEEWNLPLTQINPLFAEAIAKSEDPIWNVEWDKVTPWALASQISGIPRQGWPALDTLYNFTIYDYLGLPTEDPVTAWGLPPTDIATLGPCWNPKELCDGPDLIKSVRVQPPAFLPWQTPMYANDNFMMLGLMISNITGRSMSDIYQKVIFDQLNLTSSFSSPPTSRADLARSVIAGPPESGFLIDVPVTTPSGGLFTSSNDLAKFGIAILNSTLLPSNTTRKWMKPHSHTASLTYSLGAPWEIIRYLNPSTGKVTDLYTKLGDSGYYGANIVLIPDYNAGFSILTASTGAERDVATNIILDSITNTIVPALEAQAALEATRNYVGTYESTDSTLNSSITVAFNQSSVITSMSGLSITRWISNGTDVLASDLFLGGRPRLLLSIPKQTGDGEEGQVAFQVTPQPQLWSYFASGAKRLDAVGPFTGQYNTNYDWLVADATHYAGLGMNLFVFDVDQGGNATSLRPAAQRVTLQKK